MLEETGLPCEVRPIGLHAGEHRAHEFLALDPEGRLPAIIDPDGPDDAPLVLFDSGRILLYLAEKSGKVLPAAMSACYCPESKRLLKVIESRLGSRDWIMDHGYGIADISMLASRRSAGCAT